MNSNEFIPTRHADLWAEIAEIPQAKATLVFVDGSGEYRTVSMRKNVLMRQWLNSEGFSFLTYDKYGCGESGGKWAQVTVDILVDCLIDVCKFAKNRFLQPPVVVGQSEGAIRVWLQS
jgi:alpha-beta hydrolase superfamily lysophospholipase